MFGVKRMKHMLLCVSSFGEQFVCPAQIQMELQFRPHYVGNSQSVKRCFHFVIQITEGWTYARVCVCECANVRVRECVCVCVCETIRAQC